MLCGIGNGAMNDLHYWQLRYAACEYCTPHFSYPYGAMNFMATSYLYKLFIRINQAWCLENRRKKE
jgi:hypothetical protein